jgi:hypothetical protein
MWTNNVLHVIFIFVGLGQGGILVIKTKYIQWLRLKNSRYFCHYSSWLEEGCWVCLSGYRSACKMLSLCWNLTVTGSVWDLKMSSGSILSKKNRLWAGWSGIWILARARDLPFHHNIQTSCGTHLAPFQWGEGVKQPVHEADELPPSSVKVMNEWSYTSTPLIYLHGMCNIIFSFMG